MPYWREIWSNWKEILNCLQGNKHFSRPGSKIMVVLHIRLIKMIIDEVKYDVNAKQSISPWSIPESWCVGDNIWNIDNRWEINKIRLLYFFNVVHFAFSIKTLCTWILQTVWSLILTSCCLAGKIIYVHLALKHVFTIKHLIRTKWN